MLNVTVRHTFKRERIHGDTSRIIAIAQLSLTYKSAVHSLRVQILMQQMANWLLGDVNTAP